MRQYLKLLQHIIDNGEQRQDRTGTGTIGVFAYQNRYDLKKGFPLLTTKKVFTKAVVHELLWIISGSTNIKYLVDNGVRIWNEWAYVDYQKHQDYQGESMEEFVEKIKSSDEFAKKHGELGPVYGKQWRDFNGIDQLANLIKGIKENPFSRRHIVNAWNAKDIEKMALPPCHMFFQFYVSADNKKLSCQLYQRSADVFLGVPFNIASYALLTHMVAQVCGLEVGEFIHTFGDVHIYNDHIDQVRLQLTRDPMELGELKLNPEIMDIDKFTYDDIEFVNYKSHPTIKANVSI